MKNIELPKVELNQSIKYCSFEEALKEDVKKSLEKDFKELRKAMKDKVEEFNKTNMHKYHREIKEGIWVDVYDVLVAFEVTNPATQHAIKKLLAAGTRGYKDQFKDLEEAIVSINRALDIERDLNASKTNKLHNSD